MKWFLPILLMVAFAVGCGGRQPSELEKAASTLKPGMSEEQVKLVFKGCRMSLYTNEPGTFSNEHHNWDYQDQLYSTSQEYAYYSQFSPDSFGSEDCCFVYFDTKKIIVARRYMCMH